MYICYIDESGHCGKKVNPDQPVHVMCGVLSDLTKVFKTQREHAAILSELNKIGIPLSELKGSDAYRGRKHWCDVPAQMRDTLYEAILDWAADRSCKFVVCPIDSTTFFARKADGCQNSAKLHFPYEAAALNVLLAIQRHQQGKKNNKGKTVVILMNKKSTMLTCYTFWQMT